MPLTWNQMYIYTLQGKERWEKKKKKKKNKKQRTKTKPDPVLFPPGQRHDPKTCGSPARSSQPYPLSHSNLWEPLWEVSTMASFSTLSHTCPSQVSNPTPTAPAHKPFSSNSNDVLSFCSYASPRTAWSQNLLQIPQGPIFWRRAITWESGSRPLAFRPMIGCRTWARGSSWICFF